MIITTLLQFHNQMRVFHWQTKSYAQHIAFGSIYDSLSDTIDEFVEVFMGKYGRIQGKDGFVIKLSNYDEKNLDSTIDQFIDYLTSELPKKLDSVKDTDLLNIRDTVLGNLNKLKYLLTLK